MYLDEELDLSADVDEIQVAVEAEDVYAAPSVPISNTKAYFLAAAAGRGSHTHGGRDVLGQRGLS